MAAAKNWKQSFDTINDHIITSGILKDCNSIVYSVNGTLDQFNKMQEYISDKINNNLLFLASNHYHIEFEFPTINILKNDSEHIDCYSLYLMNKSATTPFTQEQKDWIDVMCYFNIHKYKDCLELLKEYDAVGVDYHDLPYKHFSGNFFWTKSSHVRKLPYLYWTPDRENAPLGEERHAAEAWVCKINGNYKSLHDTGIPVFERHLHKYPRSKYDTSTPT